MDSSGRIYAPELLAALAEAAEKGDVAAGRKVKQLVELDGDAAMRLQQLNRAGRRAWYSDFRAAQRRAKRHGKMLTAADFPVVIEYASKGKGRYR